VPDIDEKSGSADLPGDFAGGMITINTIDIPEKSFYSVGFSLSSHSITTGQTGYTYNGGKTDWLGFDDGTRKYPAGLPGRLDYEKSTAQEKYNNSLKFNDDWETVKIDKIDIYVVFKKLLINVHGHVGGVHRGGVPQPRRLCI
jgi:hypothetical protein